MAALVTNSIDVAITQPSAKAAPDASVTIAAPKAGYIYDIIIGGTATVVTVNRYNTLKAGDPATDYVSASLTNTRLRIPIGNGEFINPATGNAIVDFSNQTGVTAELIVVSVQ